MTEDRYSYWHAALEGQPDLAISQNDPMPGFYRTKQGRPVAIWDDEDGAVAIMVGDSMVEPDKHEDVWTRCCVLPVTEAEWQHVIDGGIWHDIDENVAETLGDNIAGADDPESILALLDILTRAAGAYTLIDSDEMAARAQTVRTRCLELKNRADKIREAEKKPHLEAGKAVDSKWQPLVKSAGGIADSVRGAIQRFETEKLRARRAAEEKARLEAEKESIDKGNGEPIPALKPVIKGGYGRAASVGTKNVVVGISDDVALYRWLFANDLTALQVFMMERAQRAVTEGRTPDGVLIEEQSYVR